jgi:hypothetical protein
MKRKLKLTIETTAIIAVGIAVLVFIDGILGVWIGKFIAGLWHALDEDTVFSVMILAWLIRLELKTKG